MNDLLLTGGTVVDGLGTPRYRADVLISEGRVQAIGAAPQERAAERIDCTGLVVAPGFVDVHSHSDQEVIRHLPNKILQGITTEVVGNCGFSLFPTHPATGEKTLTGEIFDGEPREGMATAGDYFAALESTGSLVNVAALTGHAALRVYTVGMRRKLEAGELAKMGDTLERCLDTGSIGLSTGLNCVPSSFGDRDELVHLCGIAAKHSAHYTTHMRDYKFRVLEAVEEALDLGRRTGVKVEISHLQVVGSKNWDKQDRVLELIENAARDGVEVGVDAYPYMAGSASITQLLPDWCLEGGIPAMLEHLESKATFDRIARETDDYMANTWSDIVVCHTAEGASSGLHGRSIQEIADGRGRPAVDTALHLLQEQKGIVWIISFNQSEENLRKVLTLARTSIITDGVVSSGLSHPRTFGTYPKFLGEYVRDKRWLSLEEAIVKTGARASRHFGLRGRGTLQVGNWADVVVFDPERIGTRSDYQKPDQDPEGIRLVLVNGRIAVRDGALTGVHAGQALRHEG